MIGRRLKGLRQEAGLSQSALALRMGITQQAIAKWESEKSTPDYHMLVKLADALGVSPDRLFSTQSQVPILGEVKAGYGFYAVEEVLGVEQAAVKDPEQYFYLIVQGDSMEPKIHDRDLALVRRQPSLEDGDLGVIIYGDGEGTIKRFYRKGDTVALQAFNPAYETLILSGYELDRLTIIGKVVETKTRW